MSRSPDDAEFWLPSQFLADDDVVFVDKENFQFKSSSLNTTTKATSTLGSGNNMGLFPTEFPYEFDSFGSNSALSSPVESVHSSTEAESSDEEDFFAGLTRRFAQSTILRDTQKLKPEWVLSGSPQSTLSGIGSWSCRSTINSNNGSPNGPSQVASPPTTPFGAMNDTWDLIYAAAGQVARLKMSGDDQQPPKTITTHHRHGSGLLAPPFRNTPVSTPGLYSTQSLTQNLAQFQALKPQQCGSAWGRQAKVEWASPGQQQQQPSHYQQQQIQNRVRNCGYENGRCGRPLNLPQSAWPPLQVQDKNQNHNHHQQHQHPSRPSGAIGGGLHGGSAVKRECAGTGVFLPRRYTNPPEPRKKSGCPNVLLPAKVVQALNLSFEDMNNGHSQPRFGCGFAPDHEALMARRNALLEQQRRSFRTEAALNHEIRLPQEWTY